MRQRPIDMKFHPSQRHIPYILKDNISRCFQFGPARGHSTAWRIVLKSYCPIKSASLPGSMQLYIRQGSGFNFDFFPFGRARALVTASAREQQSQCGYLLSKTYRKVQTVVLPSTPLNSQFINRRRPVLSCEYPGLLLRCPQQ